MNWPVFFVIAISIPFIQIAMVRLERRWGGFMIAATMFIPGLCIAWLMSDLLLITRHSDPVVIRAYRAENLTGGGAIVALLTILFFSLPYLTIWRVHSCAPRMSWRRPGEVSFVPPIKWSFLVILGVVFCGTLYLCQYKSLAEAVEAGDVSLARSRLRFNLAGLGPDNGIISFDSQYVMRSEPLLPLAVHQGNIEMADLLLVHGAVPSDGIGTAAYLGEMAATRLLLDAGADPSPGVEPAVSGEHVGVLDLLNRAGGDPSLGVVAAVRRNNEFLLDYLYAMGADPSCALASTDYLDGGVLDHLLERGAAPSEGLAAAIGSRNERLLPRLLEAGADPNRGMAAAAARGKLDALKLLLEYGADPDLGVSTVVREENPSTLQLLLNYGADPDLVRRVLRETPPKYDFLLEEMWEMVDPATLP